MPFELSQHAEERVLARKIDRDWIEATLTSPVRVEADALEPGLEHRLCVIPECGSRVLRVICVKDSQPMRIVTVHFDRSMKGKL